MESENFSIVLFLFHLINGFFSVSVLYREKSHINR